MEIRPLQAFEDNYIWALARGDAVAVVDPGEAAPVMRHLDACGARLCAILVTHRHGDHTEGIPELLSRWKVPVFGPARESAPVPGVDRPLLGGERIRLQELDAEFEVIAVPGHTHGHIAYYASAGPPQGGTRPPVGGSEPNLRAWGANYRPGTLFCGDVLFGAGCGRVFEGTMEEMHASLARLAALPPETAVYSAHEYTLSNLRFALTVEPGNANIAARIVEAKRLRASNLPTLPSTIGLELATNPFLRLQAPAVVAAAAARLGHAPTDDVETFKAIREWRNTS